MKVSLLEGTSGRLRPEIDGEARPDVERPKRRSAAARRRRKGLLRWVSLLTLVGPTAVAALYFGLVASPRYESETQFIVRGIQSNRAVPGLESLMQAIGIARSSDDSNVVLDYLGSRDAVAALEAALPLRAMYGRTSADALSRFPRPFFGKSFERLYWYYQSRVTALADPDTGIITVKAEAFLPEDAQAIARQLLTQSEALVNVMNARMESDTVRSAESVVAEATQAVMEAHDEVTRFRNAQMVVDPSQNAIAQLGTIADLSVQVDRVLAQISENSRLSPSSPAANALKAKADALTAQIAAEQKALAGPHSAVADKVSGYERLMVLRGLADQGLEAATASLTSARSDARRQHLYVEVIATPNLPDESTQPERLRMVASTFAVSGAAFAILWLVSVGVREHGQ
jgi:capsular polysaccharide transport system permease protein